VVEVLDEKYYRKFHLPGAINVPLDADFDKHIQNQVPEKSLPVVVCGGLLPERRLRSLAESWRQDGGTRLRARA
jgi:hypothetical protein